MLGSFEYVRADSVQTACGLLREGGGDALAYAGGTDILVEIRNGLRAPRLHVDLKRIEPLAQVETAEDGLKIGAAVSLNRIVEDAAIRGWLPALSEAAFTIATYQLRHRATLGGNLCNASPASDSIPPLLVAGASVHIVGPESERDVPLNDFCVGVKKTCLACGEIVTEIRVPAPDEGTRTAFLKQQRIKGHDLAVVNLAGALAPSGGLRIAIGSCSPTPLLLEPIDTSGHSSNAVAEEAVRVAADSVSPISDVRASAAYRLAVLPALVRRLVARLFDEGRDS